MNGQELNSAIKPRFWGEHRLLVMIVGSITISIVLIGLSLYLYGTSGAAQLDLSRPGYVDIRDKTIDSSSEFKNYATSGPIDEDAINEFKSLYDEQADKIKLAAAFKGDPLNLESLGIDLSVTR
jgi:hypothetical protein